MCVCIRDVEDDALRGSVHEPATQNLLARVDLCVRNRAVEAARGGGQLVAVPPCARQRMCERVCVSDYVCMCDREIMNVCVCVCVCVYV